MNQNKIEGLYVQTGLPAPDDGVAAIAKSKGMNFARVINIENGRVQFHYENPEKLERSTFVVSLDLASFQRRFNKVLEK